MFFILNYNEGLLPGPKQKVIWNLQNSEVNVNSQTMGKKAFQKPMLSGLPQNHLPVLYPAYIKDYPKDTFLWPNLDSPNEFINCEIFFESTENLHKN